MLNGAALFCHAAMPMPLPAEILRHERFAGAAAITPLRNQSAAASRRRRRHATMMPVYFSPR
jgi:hypothetical protein